MFDIYFSIVKYARVDVDGANNEHNKNKLYCEVHASYSIPLRNFDMQMFVYEYLLH